MYKYNRHITILIDIIIRKKKVSLTKTDPKCLQIEWPIKSCSGLRFTQSQLLFGLSWSPRGSKVLRSTH